MSVHDGMVADVRTNDFHAIMRKKTASLLHRIRSSSNSILKVFGNIIAEPMPENFASVLMWQATHTDITTTQDQAQAKF